MIKQFELVVLEVAVKVQRKHFTKKAKADKKDSPWFHADPFDLSLAGG